MRRAQWWAYAFGALVYFGAIVWLLAHLLWRLGGRR